MLLNLKIPLKDDKILNLYLTPENKLVVGGGEEQMFYNLKVQDYVQILQLPLS